MYKVFEKIPGKVWRQVGELPANSMVDAVRKVKANQKQTGNLPPIGTRFKAEKIRSSNPTVTANSIPIGEWSPAHAIRRNADGSVDILREKNSGRRANISEGFMAGGVFHPIRSAADYDASRVGEGKGKKRKAPAKKKASTKRAMATSRRDYGGDGSRYRNPGTLPTSKKNDVEYVCPDGSKTYSAAKAKRVAKKMAMDLGRNVQIHWRKYSTDKYGSYTVKP